MRWVAASACLPGGPGGQRWPALPPPPSPVRSCRIRTEAAALEQNSITSLFFFFLFVHLNVYLELHFVKNLLFSFYSLVN